MANIEATLATLRNQIEQQRTSLVDEARDLRDENVLLTEQAETLTEYAANKDDRIHELVRFLHLPSTAIT